MNEQTENLTRIPDSVKQLSPIDRMAVVLTDYPNSIEAIGVNRIFAGLCPYCGKRKCDGEEANHE